MPITINGTTGIAGVDGSAGTPSVQGADTNTGIFFPAADTIAFSEGGTEVARFDSAGKFGINTTPAAGTDAKLQVTGGTTNVTSLATSYSAATVAIVPKSTSGYSLAIASGTGDHPQLQVSAGGAASGDLLLQPYGGNLLVGTTSQLSSGKFCISFNGGSFQGQVLRTTLGTTGSTYIQFENSAGATAGYIIQNGTTTVNYVTSSDYRLKEAIVPMTGALAKVAQLKPVTYKWKVDGSDGEGFIAHELAEVCPIAVSREKDEVDADGNPQYQGIDTSFLVATLTAAIQEQQALITQLQADVAALKGASA
jgi:hypothetical protein